MNNRPTFIQFLQEMDPQKPATRDRVKGIMQDPDSSGPEANDSGARPSIKRRGQRARRGLKRRYGLTHPQGMQNDNE